jgi:enoyl-CoA hydratase
MIETKLQNGIARLTMNHGKVNAMNLEFLQTMNAELQSLKTDSQVRQLIITGNDRVFSAGVDLKRLVKEPVDYLDRFLPELTALFRGVLEFPKPVIAAINGPAVAGGCVLACAADLRVISRQAFIGVPELRVGVPFPTAGMEIMRWSATPRAFRAIIDTGATFRGEQAVTAGLADDVAEPADLPSAVERASSTFAVIPPAVFTLTKQQMRQPVLDQIERGESVFGGQIERLWRDSATRQSIADYVASRLGKSSAAGH